MFVSECHNYHSLTNRTRNTAYISRKLRLCDRKLGPGWFRFEGAAGNRMPTKCVPRHGCGTLRPGWLKGGHPIVADGKVFRKVKFRSSEDCSFKSTTIQVRNCGSYFVYFFNGTPSGGCQRYCGTD